MPAKARDLPDALTLPLASGAEWWYWLGGRPALDLVNTLRERWRRRVETLALMAGVGLPHGAVREQVASALDVVVHQARLGDGSRVVKSVTEVVRVAGGAGTRDLFCRGGELRRPGPGPLASRLDALKGDP